ncbi:hypothetical protein [Rubinisphaera italica]|uniref:hypothetical protein n=1 Tax=Rubinisphaera italica TaxID=2527969 RepID=UPI0013EEFDFF|nr:hypothetical protein [Rubinisphaera italica]
MFIIWSVNSQSIVFTAQGIGPEFQSPALSRSVLDYSTSYFKPRSLPDPPRDSSSPDGRVPAVPVAEAMDGPGGGEGFGG